MEKRVQGQGQGDQLVQASVCLDVFVLMPVTCFFSGNFFEVLIKAYRMGIPSGVMQPIVRDSHCS